jgi:hypothetical protein
MAVIYCAAVTFEKTLTVTAGLSFVDRPLDVSEMQVK